MTNKEMSFWEAIESGKADRASIKNLLVNCLVKYAGMKIYDTTNICIGSECYPFYDGVPIIADKYLDMPYKKVSADKWNKKEEE